MLSMIWIALGTSLAVGRVTHTHTHTHSICKMKQDRQCTYNVYNVTLRRACETIVAVENQEVLRILSVPL